MASMKHLLTLALGLAALAFTGNAQAEIITYQFTADIVRDTDSSNVIGVDGGEDIAG